MIGMPRSDLALMVDLYELTMLQAYLREDFNATGRFEVFIRKLPPDWGYFVMAGLAELTEYLEELAFSEEHLRYLASVPQLGDDLIEYLRGWRPRVSIRALPEGTLFFPDEPVLEMSGPLADCQLLETYVLNILGFSIISTTLASRYMAAAQGRAIVDFGLRRAQGPIAAMRAARGGQVAGFAATSNVAAAQALGMRPSGTMAHSFVQAYPSEENALRAFAEQYGEHAILLIDTYDSRNGIQIAARIARELEQSRGVKIRGIRLDSGDLVALSRFAREHLRTAGVPWVKIFASGGLDEYKIHDMIEQGAEIDGFGVGTRFIASTTAPAVDIAYKLAEYDGRPVLKTSPGKETHAGRKSLLRENNGSYRGDRVVRFEAPGDLLVPFDKPEPIEAIQSRLEQELTLLPEEFRRIRNPSTYPVEVTAGG
ncbi:MAG: nicotinate phosphoribosyltransferase [Chitinivibrionales bacterium]|nr:nicotinate phosphoribosyltransferase [Chitinivibrionales bacterium]